MERYYLAAKPVLRRVAYTLLTLLYPTITNTVLGLLRCDSTGMVVRDYLSLDNDGRALAAAGVPLPAARAALASGGATAEQAALLARPLTVPVLTADPFYVCYEAAHLGIAVLAWVVFGLYVIGYPLATLLLVGRRIRKLMRHSPVAEEWQRRRSEKTSSTMSLAGSKQSKDAQQDDHLPVSGQRRSATQAMAGRLSVAYASSASALIDVEPSIVHNASLAHFTANDYRASAFYFRQADMGLLLVLSVVITWWTPPASLADASGSLAVTLLAVLTVATMILYVAPFLPDERWKQHVKVYSLLLTGLAAVLNFVNNQQLLSSEAASGSTEQQGSTGDAVASLSIVTFIVSIGLAATLLLAFFASLWRGARREQVKVERRRSLRASLAASRKVNTGGNQESFTTGTNPLSVGVPMSERPTNSNLSPRTGGHADARRTSRTTFVNPLLLPELPSRTLAPLLPMAASSSYGTSPTPTVPHRVGAGAGGPSLTSTAASRRVVIRGSYFNMSNPLALATGTGDEPFNLKSDSIQHSPPSLPRRSQSGSPPLAGRGLQQRESVLTSAQRRMRGSVTNRLGFAPTLEGQTAASGAQATRGGLGDTRARRR
jgi:hypothetical protein